MEFNLGELLEIEIQPMKPGSSYLARINWRFTSGAILRGGTIKDSNKYPGTLWCQLPKYQSRIGSWSQTLSLPKDYQEYLESHALEKYKNQNTQDISTGLSPVDEKMLDEIFKSDEQQL
jgi:hypothetical protein